jgi:uncharacterized protein
MKVLNSFLVLFLLFSSFQSFSQKKTKEHKVVFHLSTGDTLAYRALTKQLSNVLVIWPKAKIEVVMHNKGLGMVMRGKSQFEGEMNALIEKGVGFFVCENSMKQQKLLKDQIFEKALYVPSALVEIIEKQEQGWSYIKAGF